MVSLLNVSVDLASGGVGLSPVEFPIWNQKEFFEACEWAARPIITQLSMITWVSLGSLLGLLVVAAFLFWRFKKGKGGGFINVFKGKGEGLNTQGIPPASDVGGFGRADEGIGTERSSSRPESSGGGVRSPGSPGQGRRPIFLWNVLNVLRG